MLFLFFKKYIAYQCFIIQYTWYIYESMDIKIPHKAMTLQSSFLLLRSEVRNLKKNNLIYIRNRVTCQELRYNSAILSMTLRAIQSILNRQKAKKNLNTRRNHWIHFGSKDHNSRCNLYCCRDGGFLKTWEIMSLCYE